MKFYKITPPNIEKLEENHVFLIGTNETGFHGAGAAGHAFRFNPKGNWREDEFFLSAMKANNIFGRQGKWAVYGQSEGLMHGSEGKSYGIITIKKPGLRRSRPLITIHKDIHKFLYFAKNERPDLFFFVTEIGCNYAGYSVAEIAPFFRDVDNYPNVSIPQSFADWLNNNKPHQI